MKYYVIHYTKCPERKQRMLDQLTPMGIDPEWITEYDKEDPLISQIKLKTGSTMSLGLISCSIKHFVAMKRMIDHDIPEAIILEDDCIFYPEFALAKPNHPSGFLRLGLGIGHLEEVKPPPGLKVYRLSNPAGSEAQWVTQEFARVSISNVNLDHAIDMFQYAIMVNMFREDMRCMNLCYQTSLVDRESSVTDGNESDVDWKDYCKTFLQRKRYSLQSLLSLQ